MIDFGIEQEFLILKSTGKVPSNVDIDNLYNLILENGFKPTIFNEKKQLIGVKKNYNEGTVIFKSEVCTHIFEIVFSPFEDLNLFAGYYNNQIKFFKDSLNKLNLEIFPKSALPSLNEEPIYRILKNVKDRAILTNYNTEGEFSFKEYLILISSTQIHLNILDDFFYRNLKFYYYFEYVFPLLYSTSKQKTRNAHCLRPLFYRDSYNNDYIFNSYPRTIPKSKIEYQSSLEKSVGFVKDYTLISPRNDLNTVEFRTTDTQFEIGNILEIISLRIAIHILIINESELPIDTNNSRDIFYIVCETGQIEKEKLKNDYNMLSKSVNLIDKQYVLHLERALMKIENKLNAL